MAVNPTGHDLAAFLAGDPDETVVMLNLLRFANGGRDSYARYVEAFQETIAPRYGAEVVYAGNGGTPLVAEEGQDWDAVLLVRYPSRRAFHRATRSRLATHPALGSARTAHLRLAERILVTVSRTAVAAPT